MTVSKSSTKQELLEYLQDEYGETMPEATKDEILARLSELEGKDLSSQTSASDDSSSPSSNGGTDKAQSKEQARQRKQKRVRIMIPSSSDIGGNQDVFVGVQGVAYLIKRDEEVDVPQSVVEVLQNAQRTTYTQMEDGTLRGKKVPAYPVNIIDSKKKSSKS